MPRVTPGSTSPDSPKRSGQASKSTPSRQAVPTAVLVVVVILIVLAIGAGGWYTYFGGWKTPAQQEQQWRNEGLPVFLARKGNYDLLNKTNAERAKEGKPPLTVPDFMKDPRKMGRSTGNP